MLFRFAFKWLINTLSLIVVVYLVPGVRFDHWKTALVAGLVLGMVNALLRPIIFILTLPITLMTLGLFTFFINGFTFFLVAKMVRGFTVDSYGWAFLGALVFSIISFLLNWTIRQEGNGPRHS
jgi:putative membrane protein